MEVRRRTRGGGGLEEQNHWEIFCNQESMLTLFVGFVCQKFLCTYIYFTAFSSIEYIPNINSETKLEK